ncbi:hypothetical protein L7F22_057180 [Adiantum nelumboides]|nr:hypothetical protein [Adiantum nelumboides]
MAYQLKLPNHWLIHNAFHVSLLKPYKAEPPKEDITEDPPKVEDQQEVLQPESILRHEDKDIDKKDVSLSTFKGKVLLIINVASRCGLTNSNYNGLEELYSKLKDQGFEILAFPCNQFGGQEPGTNQEIKEFACSRFKAEYPIFDKVDVNGEKTAPLYKFLKSSKSTGLLGSLLGDNIKWNFEKFLVDKRGHIVQRYEPTTSPSKIEKDIENLLKA